MDAANDLCRCRRGAKTGADGCLLRGHGVDLLVRGPCAPHRPITRQEMSRMARRSCRRRRTSGSLGTMSTVRDGRAEQDLGGVAAFGPFRLFPTARRLERDGEPVEIGGRALDVLIELVNQAGKVVSKADLMLSIWRDTTVVEGVVRTHVYNLRKALGDGVGGVRYVTSVAGRGYCFVAPVVRSASEPTSPAAPNPWKLAHGLPPRLARM